MPKAMTSDEIYALLVKKVGAINTVSRVAEQINEERSKVSQTIHYHRINIKVRQKLRAKFGVTFSDKLPIRLNQQRQERKAA